MMQPTFTLTEECLKGITLTSLYDCLRATDKASVVPINPPKPVNLNKNNE